MSLLPPDTVGKLQAALHTKAKGSPGYRFYALYDKLYRQDVLRQAYGGERCPQLGRAGFRRSAISSGVSTTHHGPYGLAWIPSRRPALHQAIAVEMSTFSNAAAARVEYRPSPRWPFTTRLGPSGQPPAIA